MVVTIESLVESGIVVANKINRTIAQHFYSHLLHLERYFYYSERKRRLSVKNRGILWTVSFFLSMHAISNLGLDATKTVLKQRILDRLSHEMNVIKELPGAVTRCLQKQVGCSVKDKEEIADAVKRISAVITILAVTVPVVYGVYKGLSGQIAHIDHFNQAVSEGKFGSVKKLKEFIKDHPFLNTQANLHELLRYAVLSGSGESPEVVSYLMKKAKRPYSFKVLQALINTRVGQISTESIDESKRILKILLENGVDPNIRYAKDQMTPLMHAVVAHLPDVVEILIEKGADKTLKNSCGKTAYDLAIEENVSKQTQDFVKPDNP